MNIHYLEIVTDTVENMCSLHESALGTSFGAPDPNLGNARTAELSGGGKIGIRAPMSEEEELVTRAYIRVDDIKAAVKAAEASGAQTIHPPLEIPGYGIFAICLTGGIQHGFWQV